MKLYHIVLSYLSLFFCGDSKTINVYIVVAEPSGSE